MVKMQLEFEGEADDVVRTLRCICGVAPDVDQGHAGAPIAPADHNQSETAVVLELETTASAGVPPPAVGRRSWLATSWRALIPWPGG